MRTHKLLLMVLLCLVGVAPSTASAQVSLLMTFASDPSGISLGGPFIGAATLNFGNVRAFGGTVASGVTRTRSGNTFILSTPIDVQVTGIGIVNNTYTLAVKQTTLDPIDIFKLSSTTINSTSFTTLTTTSTYLTFVPWTFSITIPFSTNPGLLTNTLSFLATGN